MLKKLENSKPTAQGPWPTPVHRLRGGQDDRHPDPPPHGTNLGPSSRDLREGELRPNLGCDLPQPSYAVGGGRAPVA